MYDAHPSSGEHFFLCLLLTAVKGATLFEHLHTVNDVVYGLFKEDLNSALCSSPFS
jgi:hypothetical protein